MTDWISVEDRLPDFYEVVLVYSPADENHDGGFNFDWMDIDYDNWYEHSENYEHFCSVAKPEDSIGPSQKARYTHWMPLPAPPEALESEFI